MDQLAMLWQYQVEDRKADKLEQELSRSPLRQKMNTCRTQFNAKQKQYKQMEEQVAILSDRKDAIRGAITPLRRTAAPPAKPLRAESSDRPG